MVHSDWLKQTRLWVGRREEGVKGRVQGFGSGGFEDVKILLTEKSNALRDF